MSSIHEPRYLQVVASLRRHRRRKSISQTALASILGKDQTYISKVETCERRLDIIELVDWCIALKVNVADTLPVELVKAMEEFADERNHS